jgi:hypothetical protein
MQRMIKKKRRDSIVIAGSLKTTVTGMAQMHRTNIVTCLAPGHARQANNGSI